MQRAFNHKEFKMTTHMLQQVIPSQYVFFLKFSSRQEKIYLLLHISEI